MTFGSFWYNAWFFHPLIVSKYIIGIIQDTIMTIFLNSHYLNIHNCQKTVFLLPCKMLFNDFWHHVWFFNLLFFPDYINDIIYDTHLTNYLKFPIFEHPQLSKDCVFVITKNDIWKLLSPCIIFPCTYFLWVY
jgi:hypothetical protein